MLLFHLPRPNETEPRYSLEKKRRETSRLLSLFSFPSSHIKRALQCACTYLLRVKMATSSAFIVQPNFLIKRNVFTVRFFTPARINRNFSCHRFNPFFVCGDASNFHTYKLTLTFISLSLSLCVCVCLSLFSDFHHDSRRRLNPALL